MTRYVKKWPDRVYGAKLLAREESPFPGRFLITVVYGGFRTSPTSRSLALAFAARPTPSGRRSWKTTYSSEPLTGSMSLVSGDGSRSPPASLLDSRGAILRGRCRDETKWVFREFL